jgi:hypothetical protein
MRLQPVAATADDRNPPDGSPFALRADELIGSDGR